MDIAIAGTKNIINAGVITVIDITIGRVIGCAILMIIITITVHHMKGPFSDSN